MSVAPRAGSVPADDDLQSFAVRFEYPVLFCRNALRPGDPTLLDAISRREPDRRHPVFVVVDGGLAAANPGILTRARGYLEAHPKSLEPRGEGLVVPGGEAIKNDPDILRTLSQAFLEAKLDRQAVVLTLGGGAVLDAVGFAVSIQHRGLRMLRMPSTVLSQNDGGVGVKTGVNAFGVKNLLGTFAPPHAVVNDAALLETLPAREAKAGMAEAVKVGLIRDAAFFEWLESEAAALGRCESEPVETLVRRCARLHLAHIASAGDPFETGSARPLDYGHWAAHKLESLSQHELRHGEAVAIGMALDACYARRVGLLPQAALERILRLLEALGLPRWHPALGLAEAGQPSILEGLREFGEHLGGSLSVTLLRGIGESVEVSAIDEAVVRLAIDELRERGSSS